MDKRPWFSPWIIFALYALVILSTVQLVGAMYVLCSQTIDILCVWEMILGILSVREY